MNISSRQARQIVKEISAIITQHINYIDEKGFILASTDESRIGKFHGGAVHLITNKLDSLVIHTDEQFEGTRSGLNLPIIFDDKIVGVIGITGQYDEVINYGQILRKMTEILIREAYATEQRDLELQIRSRFLDNWIFGSDDLRTTQYFIERGLALGIDITKSYRLLIIQVVESMLGNIRQGQATIITVEKNIQRAIEQKNGIFMKTKSKLVCIIPDCTNEEVEIFASDLKKRIESMYHVIIAVGIDSCETDSNRIYKQYSEATRALRTSLRTQKQEIYLYDNMGIQICLNEIPIIMQQEFVNKILRNIKPHTRTDWLLLMETFFRTEGSITLCAAKLNIHKNTLQYRLAKLTELTGFDIRLPSNAPVFYLILHFFENIHNSV